MYIDSIEILVACDIYVVPFSSDKQQSLLHNEVFKMEDAVFVLFLFLISVIRSLVITRSLMVVCIDS